LKIKKNAFSSYTYDLCLFLPPRLEIMNASAIMHDAAINNEYAGNSGIGVDVGVGVGVIGVTLA